jgi:hypothetical protein
MGHRGKVPEVQGERGESSISVIMLSLVCVREKGRVARGESFFSLLWVHDEVAAGKPPRLA